MLDERREITGVQFLLALAGDWKDFCLVLSQMGAVGMFAEET